MKTFDMRNHTSADKKTAGIHLSAFLSCLFITVLCPFLSGCGKDKASINCPFTELVWESTMEDMTGSEGDIYDSYPSIYNGVTYTYPKKYLDYDGIIKYMYDGSGKLCNVSWSYEGENAEKLTEVYEAVCDHTESLFGTGEDDDGVGNYCKIWVTEAGTVMANAVITNDTTVMQIAYMNPEISKLSGADNGK